MVMIVSLESPKRSGSQHLVRSSWRHRKLFEMWAYFRANLEPFLALISLRPIPWTERWRLFLFSPLMKLVNGIKYFPWIFSRAYQPHHVLSRDGKHWIRCIVFQPKYLPSSPNPAKPRPLHLTVHGGAFMGGGMAEHNAEVADLVCKKTGAVTVSVDYRGAPRYTFPTGHNDVEDVFRYFLTEGAKVYNIDTNNVTVSGLSAGGNHCMSASLAFPGQIKASVTFYNPVDVRIPPWEKPKSGNFPKNDPLEFMLVVYDSYAGREREKYIEDERLHVTLAPVEKLPTDMLFIIAGIDILVHEQNAFIDRLTKELEGTDRRVESAYYEDGFHGWADLPDSIGGESKADAFKKMIAFLKETNEKGGWKW